MSRDASTPRRGLDRRAFLHRTATAGAGLGAALAAPALARAAGGGPQAGGEPRVRAYKELGRTGLEIADISFGSSRTTDPAVVRHAFERGVNYFDTAEGYKDGESEKAIGEALAGVRDRVFIASKTKCGTSTTRSELMSTLEASLRRLRTDRVDVYFNHAVNDVDRLKNDEWYEFARLAKEQGKIRFTGMSGHGGRLVDCVDHAVANDLVDVLLVGYNFGQDPAFYERALARFDFVAVQPDLPAALERAHAKGIGVIAMKTLRGARLNDMRPFEYGGATFAQAAFRWTLNDENVDALIVSMKETGQIDEYLAASGGPAPTSAELGWLEDYLEGARDGYCNHGCAVCEPGCPHGVAISEVLRTRMYAADYGDLEYAREDYARLGDGAAACLGCTTQACLGRCPHGIEISRLTRSAHQLLA